MGNMCHVLFGAPINQQSPIAQSPHISLSYGTTVLRESVQITYGMAVKP